MSRAIEIVLHNSFIRVVGVYVRTFPRAHRIAGVEAEAVQSDLALYELVLEAFADDIFRAAAAGINNYLNSFMIRATASVDEFKVIYFLGRAIERRLLERGLNEIAKAHSYAMIGLLDYRLRTLGIHKPKLTKAMKLVVNSGDMDIQLGRTGCYLIYKTVATTPECTAANDQV